MSITIDNSITNANSYNARSVVRLNLRTALPLAFLSDYGLENKLSTEKLTESTFEYQKKNLLQADGKLGPATLKHILKSYNPINDQYWTYNILRSPAGKDLNLICYDNDQGLNLHDIGYFTPRYFVKRKPIQLVIHWGGLDPEHLFHCFSGNRKVSSHIGVGIVNGDAVAYQYLNLMHKAWHAGKANSTSIGIDICQQPEIRWLSYYENLGYDVQVIDNPSSRGPRQCLSLDTSIKEQLVLAIVDLCKMFNIPMVFPDTDQVLSDWKSFKGILGHHHISSRKWDCAPWFNEIEQAILSQ